MAKENQLTSMERVSALFDLIATEVLGVYNALDVSSEDSAYEKSPNEYVTQADYLLEKKISKIVLKAFPQHSIIGEETGQHLSSSDFIWYIDPIDGTNNFMRRRSEYATSVGLSYKGDPIAGLIIYPVEKTYVFGNTKDSSFHIIKNGKSEKSQATIQHHLFVGLPSNGLRNLNLEGLLVRDDIAFRASGAIGYDLGKMCLGQLDIRYGGNFKPEDVVAGIALLRASGGLALTNEGESWTLESRSLIAVRKPTFKDTALGGGRFND